MDVTISEMTIDDYAAAYGLWEASEGVRLNGADSKDAVRAYLLRNRGLSFVAKREGKLLGAALCGHDGRRGYLHHLAVDASCRRHGIGRALVERCLKALRALGIRKCHLLVYSSNAAGQEFWQAIGWSRRDDLLIMSKELGDGD